VRDFVGSRDGFNALRASRGSCANRRDNPDEHYLTPQRDSHLGVLRRREAPNFVSTDRSNRVNRTVRCDAPMNSLDHHDRLWLRYSDA
jgi:hypothetical protein